MLIEARVVARRTSGSAGAAGDSAVYVRVARAKNIAGTVSLSNIQSSVTFEDQNSWNATLDVSGTSVRVRVNGAANNNVDWGCTYFTQQII
jgi:hypothetical protein